MSFDELLLCPIHILSIILRKALQDVIRVLLSCIVIMAVDHLISPHVALSASAIAMVLVVGLMFFIFEMPAGMLVNKSQMLTLFSSLAIVPMIFLYGTLFDVDTFLSAAEAVIYLLPLTHVNEIVRRVMLDIGVPPDSVLITTAYLVIFFAVCWWMIKTNRADPPDSHIPCRTWKSTDGPFVQGTSRKARLRSRGLRITGGYRALDAL